MFEDCRKCENVSVVQRGERKIRVAQRDDETVFALRDVLACFNIKYPDKFISRRREICDDENAVFKLGYPFMSSYGRRVVSLYFATGEYIRELMEQLYCTDEMMRFLADEVLTFKFPEEGKKEDAPADVKKPANQPTASQAQKAPDTVASVNARIDTLLLELLELKKLLCC